jgi:predicted metal-dependent enzyme (double-stranded beta helix superfamily)
MPAATPASRCPAELIAAIRGAVAQRADWAQTAARVAAALRGRLPGPDLLTPQQRRGDPAGYRSHLLHTEPDGSFSVVGVVWRPGQVTPVHDHVAWCVAAVLQGTEHEERFTLAPGGGALEPAGTAASEPGEVTGFAPPGDIHRVRARGGVTVAVHVYGADIARLGSSVRRVYQLPVRTPAGLLSG